jgi:hypothetical protein
MAGPGRPGDTDIPVKFNIMLETRPGQRVALVGSW